MRKKTEMKTGKDAEKEYKGGGGICGKRMSKQAGKGERGPYCAVAVNLFELWPLK